MNTREVSLPDLNGGLNVRDPEYAINDNQSPDLLNCWWKNKTLAKRPGTISVTALTSVHCISDLYNSYKAVHAGTNLYKWDGTTATKISTDGNENQVANAGVFIQFGRNLYYLDGAKIWAISSTYVLSEVTPYVPVVMINCAPDLSSSDDNEAFNLIGAGFTVKYNGNGTAAYTLPQAPLDNTAVIVKVDGTTKTVTTHYTCDKDTGIVTFTSGNLPATGTNNVEITAYKTVTGAKSKIAGCKAGIPFGGEQGLTGGTRVFLMGNSSYPTAYWRSDLSTSQGMKYFPDTSEEYLDQNDEPITACAKMGNQLIIFKPYSIFAVGYEFDGETAYYPVRECHSSIGCDIPLSIQLIDNRLVFAHSAYGINLLVGTSTQLENNVKPISGNINNLLKEETSITAACSADFDRYYWFCVNGNVYLWDYDTTPYYNYGNYDQAQRRLAWYKWSGIDASIFNVGDYLYFANSAGIKRFQSAQNDSGAGYTARITTKAFDMGDPSTEKTFTFIYPSFSKDGHVKSTVTVVSEDDNAYREKEFEILTFGFDRFRFDVFSFGVVRFVKTYRMRVKLKKTTHMQIEIKSTEANRGLGLAGLRVAYFPLGKIRR